MDWQQNMTNSFYADLQVQGNDDEEDGNDNFEGISGIEERKSRHGTAPRNPQLEQVGGS